MLATELQKRIERVRPGARALLDYAFRQEGGGFVIDRWSDSLGAKPTDAELLAVDLSQPTAQEASLAAAIQILKADVPDSWRTSLNAQQRIAWAMKRLFVEGKRELEEGGA